jgi:hypothetical protein
MDDAEIKARTEAFAKTFVARLNQEAVGSNDAPNTTLYHYTAAEGLHGIIETGNIWATNYRYVNDLTEFVYANTLLREEIERRLSPTSPSITPLAEAVLIAIRDTPDLLVGAVDIYIACFCEDGDLLSQWRAYGGRGGGFAIGFKIDKIQARLVGKDYYLYRVNYDETKQKEIIRFLIDSFLTEIDELGTGVDPKGIAQPAVYSEWEDGSIRLLSSLPNPLGALCVQLTFCFLELACCFKNPNFEVEKEWRLVIKSFSDEQALHPDLKFRVSGSTVIPYLELPLYIKNHRWGGMHNRSWNFALEKIIYGPGMNPPATERSLKYLTAKFIKQPVEVQQSKIKVKV